MIVITGKYKGRPVIRIWKTQEDADRDTAGEKVFPAFSCGVKKGEAILGHLKQMLQFVQDNEGELQPEVIEAIENL